MDKDSTDNKRFNWATKSICLASKSYDTRLNSKLIELCQLMGPIFYNHRIINQMHVLRLVTNTTLKRILRVIKPVGYSYDEYTPHYTRDKETTLLELVLEDVLQGNEDSFIDLDMLLRTQFAYHLQL